MGFDVDAHDPLAHEIDGRGAIDPETARRLRLEYAERLERDVLRATPVQSDD